MQRARMAVALCAVLVTAGVAGGAEVAPGDVPFDNGAVVTAIADQPGNIEEGAKVFKNRGLGNCLACHAVAALEAEQFHGDVAPPP